MVQKKLPLINSAHGSETRNIINEIIKVVNDRGLEILSESGFLTWLEKNGIKHREEVATFADLPSSDALNTVRGVESDNKIYIKKENGWVPFQTIDISKINEVEEMAIRRIEELAITPMKFGAVGDGIIDDSDALQQANDFARENNLLLDLIDRTYRVKNTVILDANIDGRRSTLICDNIPSTAIQVGRTESTTRNIKIILPVIKNSTLEWNDGSIGCKFYNLSECDINVRLIERFSEGLVVSASNTGTAYNSFKITHLRDNKSNLIIRPEGTGWVNENTFHCDRFSYTNNTEGSIPGFAHLIFDGFYNGRAPNNNVFMKPSFENRVENVILFNNARHNLIINGRYEIVGNGRQVVFEGLDVNNPTHSNVILYGYNSEILKVIKKENASYNHIYSRNGLSLEGTGKSTYSGVNNSGNSAGIFSTYKSNQDVFNATENDYVTKLSGLGVHVKNTDDVYDRVSILSNGYINIGNGTNPEKYIVRRYGGRLRIEGGDVEIHGGGYDNGHLMLGNHHLWIDGLGNLRIKSSAPTSDTDGRKLLME